MWDSPAAGADGVLLLTRHGQVLVPENEEILGDDHGSGRSCLTGAARAQTTRRPTERDAGLKPSRLLPKHGRFPTGKNHTRTGDTPFCTYRRTHMRRGVAQALLDTFLSLFFFSNPGVGAGARAGCQVRLADRTWCRLGRAIGGGWPLSHSRQVPGSKSCVRVAANAANTVTKFFLRRERQRALAGDRGPETGWRGPPRRAEGGNGGPAATLCLPDSLQPTLPALLLLLLLLLPTAASFDAAGRFGAIAPFFVREERKRSRQRKGNGRRVVLGADCCCFEPLPCLATGPHESIVGLAIFQRSVSTAPARPTRKSAGWLAGFSFAERGETEKASCLKRKGFGRTASASLFFLCCCFLSFAILFIRTAFPDRCLLSFFLLPIHTFEEKECVKKLRRLR